MARLSRKPYRGIPALDYQAEPDVFEQQIAAQIQALEQLETQWLAQPVGTLVGGLLRFPVSDGEAHYRVIKEKPLTLQWIDVGDGLAVEPYVIRGLRRADVDRQLRLVRRLAELK